MSLDFGRLRSVISLAILSVIATLVASPALAGGGHHRVLVPVVVQQAPTPYYYSAPQPLTYPAQAPLVYSAPVAPMYSAPMATQYMAAPAPMTYQAPAVTQPGVGYAPGATAGSRLKAVDRADIIELLRKEYKDAGTDGTRRDRRKALRESAGTKFGEMIGDDAEGLNASELQDIENIVSSIMDASSNQAGQAQTIANGASYGGYGYSAPVGYAPPQQVTYVQPVVPVQYYVPRLSKAPQVPSLMSRLSVDPGKTCDSE